MSDLDFISSLARTLMDQHLPPGWTFEFDHARRRAGACHFRTQRITMSRILVPRYDDATNHQTLLHEIAHAQVGHAAGHGHQWLRAARALGYQGGVRHDGEAAEELARWVGTCPAGHVVYRFRRPTRVVACARCARRFDPRYLIQWREREVVS